MSETLRQALPRIYERLLPPFFDTPAPEEPALPERLVLRLERAPKLSALPSLRSLTVAVRGVLA